MIGYKPQGGGETGGNPAPTGGAPKSKAANLAPDYTGNNATPGSVAGGKVAPDPPDTMGGAATAPPAVGADFMGSKVVKTGTHSSGVKVYALADGRIVDEQGRPAQ
jgi:hypothetical protein